MSNLTELSCEQCKEHYLHHRESLDFAFSTVGFSRNQSTLEVASDYFTGFHNRGHRKALRDDV